MGRNLIESVMGAVVLLVAASFVYFAWVTADINQVPGYPVSARFYQVGGLESGSDVRLNGIRVGSVTDVQLDSATFDAIVTLNIDERIRLPIDTVVMIETEGLLGGKYVRLTPGRGEALVEPGGTFANTRDFRSLEDQISEIIFLATSPPESGRDVAPDPAATPAPDAETTAPSLRR